MNDITHMIYLILAILISFIVCSYSKDFYNFLTNKFPKRKKLIKIFSIIIQNILMIISLAIGISLLLEYSDISLLPVYIAITLINGTSKINYINYSFWVNQSILMYCIYTGIIK